MHLELNVLPFSRKRPCGFGCAIRFFCEEGLLARELNMSCGPVLFSWDQEVVHRKMPSTIDDGAHEISQDSGLQQCPCVGVPGRIQSPGGCGAVKP